MAAISETLRQARLRSGFDLDRLAERTKIRARYLQAIEAGDFDQLPSGSFARMFVRQFADAVGLDGASVSEEFARSTSYGRERPPDLQTIASLRDNFQPTVPGLTSVGDRVRNEQLTSMLSSLIWVVAAVLACAGAYYGLAHLPAGFNLFARGTAATAVQPQVKPPAKTATEALPPPAPVPEIQTDVKEEKAEAASEAPQTGATPPVSGPIQLAISATETVWVTATADGQRVIAETMNPGSSKTVAAEKQLRLTLGNAGGVEITLNGKKLEPIGPKGAVRTVDFTPWGAQVLSRTPPPNPDPVPPSNPDPLR